MGETEGGAKDVPEKIETKGRMRRAMETGDVQRENQQVAFSYQRQVGAGERVVVGVNRYKAEDSVHLPLLHIPPEIERGQVERLKKLRARRDGGRATAALAGVEAAARAGQNLMPPIFEAVKSYATVGEISDALRRVFGEYQESVVI